MSKITLDLDRWKGVLTRDDGWKQLQQHLLNDVLDAEMTEHAGAARYERKGRRTVTGTGRGP